MESTIANNTSQQLLGICYVPGTGLRASHKLAQQLHDVHSTVTISV